MIFNPPQILPLAVSGQRPFWSVMIPTYNARADYLEETLRSILDQAPGLEQMQIEVVDDCSPNGAPLELVRRIAGDRVAVHCEPKNNGLAGIWNRCIERASGEWIHILHQDDIILPGFYEKLRAGIAAAPDAGMAYCRFALMDGGGHWKELGPIERLAPGVLEGWLERVTTGYHVECPAVVVRRRTYEDLGGFTSALRFALDLEMWVRIAVHFPVYYHPQILACYRRHGANETSVQQQTGRDMMDVARALQLWKQYLPPHVAERLFAAGSQFWAETAVVLAQKFYSENKMDACSAQLKAAEVLWDRGTTRKRRLKLAAKVKIHRIFGTSLITALRNLRRRLR